MLYSTQRNHERRGILLKGTLCYLIPCSVFTSLRRGMKWVVSWSNFDLKFTDFVELPVPFSLSKSYINNIEIFFIFFMSRDLLRAKFWLSFMNLGLFRRELITELNYITTLCFENIISLKKPTVEWIIIFQKDWKSFVVFCWSLNSLI